MGRLWLVALLCVAGCSYGYKGQDVVRVGVISQEWSEIQLIYIQVELDNLTRAYGVTFEVSEDKNADVHLHNIPRSDQISRQGSYPHYSNDTEINTANRGLDVPYTFCSVVGHEISHWLGMEHVSEAGNMMSVSAAQTIPTKIDLAEFHRATGR